MLRLPIARSGMALNGIIPIERLIESRGEEIPEAMINALREKSIAFGK